MGYKKKNKTNPIKDVISSAFDGKGVRVFCQQESIKYSTFWYWGKKFKASTLPNHDFIEMKVDKIETKSSQPHAELRLTDKGALIFYELPEPAWI